MLAKVVSSQKQNQSQIFGNSAWSLEVRGNVIRVSGADVAIYTWESAQPFVEKPTADGHLVTWSTDRSMFIWDFSGSEPDLKIL